MGDYSENSEYEFFKGKLPNKTYVSKRVEIKVPEFNYGEVTNKIIPLRFASKVIDTEYCFEFIKEKQIVKLRITDGDRQEITAKFLEDSRKIQILQIQKFTTTSGSPHKTAFSFRNDEIKILFNFLKSIPELHLENELGVKITDEDLKKLIITKEQAYSIYKDNKDIFAEILDENITQEDIKNLVYKKNQLEYFDKLLYENDFFEKEKLKLGIKSDEALWQNYFENNTWIFGFGLQYLINIPLENRKLEQVVDGYDIVHRGKRVDALMKFKGIISSLCFAEIKTHKTQLLNSSYRPNVFPPSNELSGGISQIQKTVQSSLENLINKISPVDISGNPTGEEIFVYKPKSFLLIGSMNEFISEFGVNKEKYSCFELYRKSLKDIEIITFDELLERAKFIVHSNEK